jgi:hypothetical protein
MSIEFPNGRIEEGAGGSVIATGPDATRFFTLVSLASALGLEINTGLKLSRGASALDAAKIQGIIPKGKRGNYKAALAGTIEAIQQMRPDYTPNPSVKRAMDKLGLA